jgi:hypothetical protein
MDRAQTSTVSFYGLNPSGFDFTLILSGRGFRDNYLFKPEFIKRLLKRYQQGDVTVL